MAGRFYSIVVPVYNRPEEIQELLESLTQQSYQNFEVLIVEDGSSRPAEQICKEYEKQLNLRYFTKENTGQGFSRNYGFDRAKGEYFIVFDSDCVIPEQYLEAVEKALDEHEWDAFGGPDAAALSFSPLQKAISYSMTAVLTTGGIRGKQQSLGKFHPRSFNMGLSRKVYEETGGFAKRDMGEDMELSRRLIDNGYKVGLIPDAAVYHKRRGNFRDFFKQIFSFGRTRIQLKRNYGIPIKAVHALPVLFTLGIMIWPVLALVYLPLFWLETLGLGFYILMLFLNSSTLNRSLWVGALSVVATFVQMLGYGLGFLKELFFRERE